MSEQDRLAQVVELVKAGKRAEAEPLVAEVIRADRKNARAWILMAKIVDDPQKALQCWQEVARLKPDDPRVQEEIAKLKGESISRFKAPAQPPSVPPVQPINSEPFQSIAPAKQKKKSLLPLLIGGGAIVVVICCVAIMIVAMNMPSDPNDQAGVATTVAEQSQLTNVPALARATLKHEVENLASEMAPVAPDETSEPTAPPASVPVGLSRSNPFSRGDTVSAPNWDVQVMEIRRGEEAWIDIQAANSFNEAAPAGMEYLLVKLHVKSTYSDSEEHSISGCDFDVTGDKLIHYTCSMASIVEPDPQLDARLFTGGETEGWAGYLVAQGESNLLLVVNEMLSFDADAKRYIALDDGASITISSDLANIKPTNAGIDRNTPAPKTEKIVSEDWEWSIVDVIRGNDAWTMVQEANQFNDPPAEGFEYIAVKIHVRYIGTEDGGASIDGSFFNTTGSANILHDVPSVVDPSPQLDIHLYPGGEYEGWVVVQASQGETNMVLVFEPFLDLFGTNTRFILLE